MKRFCRLFIFLIVLSGWIPHLAAAQDVNMPDASLAAIVRDELNLAPNARITRQALQRLTRLSGGIYADEIRQFIDENGAIKDLTGLEHAPNLLRLSLVHHDISDLGPLKGLTRLERLGLSYNEISDLGPLARLTQLRALIIVGNPINDFSPLTGLKQLENLSVPVRSVAVMSNLRRHVDLAQLEILSVHSDGNQIGDLHPFANLTQLEGLILIDAQINDITPLAKLTQLKRNLNLHNNQISDITPMASLTQLENLHLSNNQISDITSLGGLTQLEFLSLGVNQIRDVTPLADLTQLWGLSLGDNQIRDVTPLAGLTQLRSLDLRNNQIRDVKPIQHLIDSPSTQVLLEGNPIGGGSDLVIATFQANHIKSMKEIRLTGPGPGTEISSILPEQKFDLYATIKNQGTKKSTKTRVKFYRSTDENISPTDDTLLKAVPIKALPEDGTAKASYTVLATKTPITYYYGACVDSVDNEEKTDNNCTAALKIEIRGLKPDLRIRSIKVAKKGTSRHSPKDWKDTLALNPGDAFDIRVIVLNGGDRTAETTDVTFYRSSDAEISQDDEKLKTTVKNNLLPPNTTDIHIVTFRIPEAGGTYYYGVRVVPVEDESRTENNWSVGVRVGAETLELPENLISDVALTPNATYFVVNAQFPRLKNQNRATYGSCLITLGIPGVPDAPLEEWDSTDPLLAGDPPYFMFPLLSPRERIEAVGAKYALDIKEVFIGGAVAVVAGGVGQKLTSLVPVGKVAQHTDKAAPLIQRALSVGSKFNLLIPAEKVEEGLAKGGHYVISKVIGQTTNFLTATGLRTVSDLIGGDEEEPSIEDELLAFTADPTLILTPISAQQTRPKGEARYLFRIPKQQLTEIAVTVEQVYFVGKNAFTAKYEGVYPLEGAAAAPGLAPMSFSDYPPFQWLSPEAQAYLLRDFGVFTSAETWQVPATTALLPNYPNPFNPETWIPYQLAKPSDVSLTLHDINGRVVRTLDLGHRRAGIYRSRGRAAYWDGKNEFGEPVASGLYFYTLTAGDFSATRKMLIRK